MKKALSKILARMAKDGDVETVAEIIEEMIEGEASAPEPVEEVAEVVAEAAKEPAAVVETPEGTTVVVDEAALGDIVFRLDRIISLLTPAPAADEDPAEEIAEAVEEVIEAAAEAPEADPTGAAAEVAEIVEEVLEAEAGGDVPEVLSADEDECEEPRQEVISTGDTLRAVLKAVRPALAKMPKKQRERISADIAARLNGKPARTGIYSAMADATRRRSPVPGPDLGKKIMASRNPNYKK